MAALVADPLIGLRGGPPTGTSISEAAAQAAVAARVAVQSTSPPAVMAGMGGICNEDIRVPDKMVGLSKYKHYPRSPLSKRKKFQVQLPLFHFFHSIINKFNIRTKSRFIVHASPH